MSDTNDKRTPKKLTLNKETLLQLTASEAELVAGGTFPVEGPDIITSIPSIVVSLYVSYKTKCTVRNSC